MLKQKDICVAITEMLNTKDLLYLHRLQPRSIPSSWFEPQVIILFGDYTMVIQLVLLLSKYEENTKSPFRKVWILTSHSEIPVGGEQLESIHGTLQFRVHRRDVPEFKPFLKTLTPPTRRRLSPLLVGSGLWVSVSEIRSNVKTGWETMYWEGGHREPVIHPMWHPHVQSQLQQLQCHLFLGTCTTCCGLIWIQRYNKEGRQEASKYSAMAGKILIHLIWKGPGRRLWVQGKNPKEDINYRSFSIASIFLKEH